MSLICIRQHVVLAWRKNHQQTSFARSEKSLSTGIRPPSDKLRVLVSLYHLADTFITPENLSRKIDEAFIPSLREDNRGMVDLGGASSAKFRAPFVTVQGLRETLEKQRKAPKVMEPDRETKNIGVQDYGDITTWSGERRVRERRVMEALYGVERIGGLQVLPGLDVLVEEGERMERDMKADKDLELSN